MRGGWGGMGSESDEGSVHSGYDRSHNGVSVMSQSVSLDGRDRVTLFLRVSPLVSRLYMFLSHPF